MTGRALILIEGNTTGTGLMYIQAAQRLGLHPVTLAADPTRFEYLTTEKIETVRVDTTDLEALIRECSRLGATYDIAGITCAKEAFYATVGKLCRYFNLPGPTPWPIERCCDKVDQRRLLGEGGVSIPNYRVAANAKDVERCAVEIGLPVVLKPAEGSGSIGVRLCRTSDELAEHVAHLLGGNHIWRSTPRILVEEFARGSHYSVDMMGNEVIGIAAAEFGEPPHFVCCEYTYPAVLTGEQHRRIVDTAQSSLRALGLGWGPANIDLRWTERGPVVIEVNPRMAATPTPQLFKLAYGVDLITEYIKLVIGDQWDLRKRHSQTAGARILIPSRDGILHWIDKGSRAVNIPGVAEVKLYTEHKAPIVRRGDTFDRIGYVIAASPSLSETEAILQRATDLIQWAITPFPAATEQE